MFFGASIFRFLIVLSRINKYFPFNVTAAVTMLWELVNMSDSLPNTLPFLHHELPRNRN